MQFKTIEISRVTVHKVFSKSKTVGVPYASSCEDFCQLGLEGTPTLIKRIENCIKKTSHFFELDMHNESAGSAFDIQKDLYGLDKKEFLIKSQHLADLAASVQVRSHIPDGLILIVETKIDNHNSFIFIKAEKSDAFSMTGSALQLVKDIFLSSDKTLYKLGIFIHVNDKSKKSSNYRYFVYDDDFTPSKEDLALYFYESFLGLTTEKNSKLLTNKMHKKLKNFVEDNVAGQDQFDILRSIDRVFLDNRKTTLSHGDFKDLFPSEFTDLFHKQIALELPTAFIKDNEIIKNINTHRIRINSDATLIISPDSEVITSGSTIKNKDRLKTVIDSNVEADFIIIGKTKN